jgi:hypothetical protein
MTSARSFVNELRQQIRILEEQMRPGQVLSVQYHTPHSIMTVHYLGWRSPNMIALYGADQDGALTAVFAHYETMQLMVKIVRPTEGQPESKFGFVGEINASTPIPWRNEQS